MLPSNQNSVQGASNFVTRTTLVVVLFIAGFFLFHQHAVPNTIQETIKSQLEKSSQSCGDVSQSSSDRTPSRSFTYTMRNFAGLEDLSASSSASWDTTFSTPQGGFLWVKHNETMDVPWGVSMFHAIHCLTLLRGKVQRDQSIENATTGHEEFDSTHIGHCFSYIAQVGPLPLQCPRPTVAQTQLGLAQFPF